MPTLEIERSESVSAFTRLFICEWTRKKTETESGSEVGMGDDLDAVVFQRGPQGAGVGGRKCIEDGILSIPRL